MHHVLIADDDRAIRESLDDTFRVLTTALGGTRGALQVGVDIARLAAARDAQERLVQDACTSCAPP